MTTYSKSKIFFSKINFYVLSLKKNIISAIFLIFTMCLVVFSNSNLYAAKSGLKLWANNVIPALFPFFIATEMLSYTDISQKISKLLTPFMKPIFNVPGCGAYAFLLGIISGYPVGAKIVSSLVEAKLCSKSEGERMLAFTNNSGPLFIIGTVGITMFRNTSIGIILLITHILSAITIGILLGIVSRIKQNKDTNYNDKKQITNHINSASYNSRSSVNINNLGEIISNSILSAIKTTLLIGGFVVLFSVVISILSKSNILNIFSLLLVPICKILKFDPSFIKGILIGLIELTNGLSFITNIATKNLTINIVLCSFLLGFGGLSVLLQVLSIVSKFNLSLKNYIICKLLQGIIASLYTYILISQCAIFNFSL